MGRGLNMRSNVQLYRLKKRQKIKFLKLQLLHDYRADRLKEMKLTYYGIWQRKTMREYEIEQRDLDEFGPNDG